MRLESNSDQILNWIFWQVCIPLLFVVVAMGLIYLSHRNFTATLADGELLLLGTLLSLGLTGEMFISDSKSTKLLKYVSFLLCLVFTISYVLLKRQLSTYEVHDKGAIPDHIHVCALISFGLGGIAISWSILGYLLFMKQGLLEKVDSSQ